MFFNTPPQKFPENSTEPGQSGNFSFPVKGHQHQPQKPKNGTFFHSSSLNNPANPSIQSPTKSHQKTSPHTVHSVAAPQNKVNSDEPHAFLLSPPPPDHFMQAVSTRQAPHQPKNLQSSHPHHLNSIRFATSPHKHNPLAAQVAAEAATRAYKAGRELTLEIGDYKLGRTLGSGSFSKVKLGLHKETGHKVAIKILSRNKLNRSGGNISRSREIQILKLLWHPNIIRLYDVIETPTDIFLIMEYVSGGELFDYIIQHGRSSENQVYKFFHQIIFAIDYCHRHKIVHRDVKPENLLLSKDLDVKIADFGLSNVMRDGEFLFSSCGSPNYAAPEVISGKPYAGPEVDVWSCGVIFYALLCGRLPFDEDYIPALFKKIRAGQYIMPPWISDLAKDLISKMLVVDPVARISIPDIIDHPWFKPGIPPHLLLCQKRTSGRALSEDEIDIKLLHKVLKSYAKGKDQASAFTDAVEQLKKGTMTSITVAYHLHKDHERRRTLPDIWVRDNQIPNGAELLAKSPPPSGSGFFTDSNNSISSNSVLSPPPPSVPDRVLSPLGEKLANQKNNVVYTQSGQVSLEWTLGFSSSTSPAIIMTSVYVVLKKLGFQWKFSSAYDIRVKYSPLENVNPEKSRDKLSSHIYKPLYEPLVEPNSRGLQSTLHKSISECRIGIKLYSSRRSQYLLDFRYLAGDHLTCIEQISIIMSMIKHLV